jgi:hypothetical protein
MPPSDDLDLETYAMVVAHVRFFAGEPSTAVVARFGISEARWASAGTKWLEQLAAEADDAGSGPLSRSFGASYAATLGRLRKDRPALTDVGEDDARDRAPSTEERPSVAPPTAMSVWQVSRDAAAMPAPPLERPTLPRVDAADDDIDVDATIEAVLREGATLPFGVKASAEFESWLASREETPKSRADAFSTVEGEFLRPTGAALPFSRTGELPAMPLEQYASLCAALAVFPQRAQEIVVRFGVADEGAKLALDAAWRAAFTRSPADLLRWQELFSQFCAAMTRQG